MDMSVKDWLQSLGLAQYTQAFLDNDIDAEVLSGLTIEDLTQLGVTSIGHRRKMLLAIAALQTKSAARETGSINQTNGRSEPLPAQAERRQVTVVFCDLVGSTELSRQLDPEDMSTLLKRYRNCCAETIARWDGYIAQFLGDGVLAYFGWPRAHEDDAERGVRAGLDLVGAVSGLTTREGKSLAARVGIATGQVVAGELCIDGGVQERNVVGDTPNLAARLQSSASPNSVIIAPDTRRLLGSLFEFREFGPLTLKGFADPIMAYEVGRPRTTESRFEALRAEKTPLVGRNEEIGVLMRRWQQAKDGEGQVVLFSGEAGIGKSRISATLLEKLAEEPHTRLRYFCSPHHTTSPLHPFVSQLERAAGLDPDDSPQVKLDKLEALLAPSSRDLTEDATLFAELLAIPTTDRYPSLKLTPQQKKDKTLAALSNQLAALAAGQTVLMIFEDAHWIDPTSLELLEISVTRTEKLPVMMVITFRPEFQPPWVGLSHVTLQSLNKLNRRESIQFLDRLTGGKPLPNEVSQQIIEHTDGIPLFMEELTKTVLEGQLLEENADRFVLTGPLPPLAIPTSLQASLMARLDRLASLKDVAQIGSVIGREFSFELLAAAAGRSDEELHQAIDQLVAAGLIFRRGTPPHAILLFKHALVQDAAYASMLRNRRQELHARIARVLEEGFSDVVETQPELLAHHYSQAGLTEKAIDYWILAGDRALQRSGNLEASRHFNQGIELIKTLPSSPDRKRREFRLYLGLGPAIRAIKGYNAPETVHAFTKVRDLIGESTSRQEQMAILYGIWGVYFVRPNLEESRLVAQKALELVAQDNDAELHALANRMMAESLCMMGRQTEAHHYMERAIEYCDASSESARDLRFSMDHRVGALTLFSWTLWSEGYLERAVKIANESYARAMPIDHAATSAMALLGKTVLAELRRDPNELLGYADEQAKYCAERSIPMFEHWGRFGRGVAQFLAGDSLAGIETMRKAMAVEKEQHAGLFLPMHLGCLAEAHARIGEQEVALDLLDQAITQADNTQDCLFEAELYRLRGNLLLERDRTAAEASFERSIAIARKQGSKLWELRTGVDLASLWRNQGNVEKARNLLEPIYGWFTEGFDTPDLKAAKSLLNQLRRKEYSC